MKIETSDFRNTHSKAPRGDGHWIFAIGRRPGEFTFFSCMGTYAEACRAVKAEARNIGGVSSITLQS